MNIRPARVDEARTLSGIAVQSEAYWDYDAEYMKAFATSYKVTEAFIQKGSTFVIEEDLYPIGFFGILVEENRTWLEYFYIHPTFIGKGYGRCLWNHLLAYCRNCGIQEFELVTSPEAREFYIRMGAVQIGEIESLVRKGRMVPHLLYSLKEAGG